MSLLPLIVAIAVPALTGLVAYFVSRRNTSGNVRQTPAEKLWDAAEHIRGELAVEVEKLRIENNALRQEQLVTNQRLWSAEQRIRELEARMDAS